MSICNYVKPGAFGYRTRHMFRMSRVRIPPPFLDGRLFVKCSFCLKNKLTRGMLGIHIFKQCQTTFWQNYVMGRVRG